MLIADDDVGGYGCVLYNDQLGDQRLASLWGDEMSEGQPRSKGLPTISAACVCGPDVCPTENISPPAQYGWTNNRCASTYLHHDPTGLYIPSTTKPELVHPSSRGRNHITCYLTPTALSEVRQPRIDDTRTKFLPCLGSMLGDDSQPAGWSTDLRLIDPNLARRMLFQRK